MSKANVRAKRTPKKNNSAYWIIGGVAAAAILVLVLVLINLNAPRGTPITAQASAGRTLGQSAAPVTVDLYADFQCPICRREEAEIRQIIPTYIDTGKAKIVFHNFAFIGTESTWAAEAAECANDQNKFWEYAFYLYDHQGGENTGAFSKDNLKQFANDLKLDAAAFGSCLDSDKYAAAVKAEFDEGSALGVTATPSFRINGRFYQGFMTAAQLANAMDGGS